MRSRLKFGWLSGILSGFQVQESNGPLRILAFDTEGNPPGNFEDRIRALLADFEFEYFAFNRAKKFSAFLGLLNKLRLERPQLAVMEGTGTGGGLALLLARWFFGVRYVFSSGDAVAPFLSLRWPWFWPIFWLYEVLLYRFSSGFIGWTPYLCGRALSFGAPRAVVAAGWSPIASNEDQRSMWRREIRTRLGIPQDALVVGIVGSLSWNDRRNYCYGLEVVEAVRRAKGRENVFGLVVGGGSGLAKLKQIAGEQLGKRIFLSGPVPRDEVPKYLSAMDMGSLPQSRDGVGSFRYTTKVSEYVACGLPFVVGPIPMSYDFDGKALWHIRASFPWSEEYWNELGELLSGVQAEGISERRMALRGLQPMFDGADQRARVAAFIRDVIAARD